ncbi:MAG: HAD family hydrolase [Litorimonas sp.]
MVVNLRDYASLVFDCDGVLLNSNKIKTEAFYEVALPFGSDYAKMLVDYHIEHGGISRFEKFKHFCDTILPDKQTAKSIDLVERYAEIVYEKLLASTVAPGLKDLRVATSSARWYIVSGGKQSELRAVFKAKGLDQLFDGGIYGSPDDKIEIFKREIAAGNMILPALYLGDSKYDYYSSQQNGLDFVFVSGWSEVSEWETFCEANSLNKIIDLSNLIPVNDTIK